MSSIDAPFYLEVTLCCGQIFRWDRVGEWWYIVVGDRVFKVRQVGGKLEFEYVDVAFLRHYFSLDIDLQKILDSINKDGHVSRAIEAYWGLRLIRQEPVECLFSYICATYKSIPAIKHMLNNLSRKFGHKVSLDGLDFFTFPHFEKLAAATEKQLKECGLGYRARYVHATAQKLSVEKFDLEGLRKIPYLEAKKELMELPGVGAKVADCVLLFSLDKTEAFPVDVWVKRVILNHYRDKLAPDLPPKIERHSSLGSKDYEMLNAFGRNYFGEYAGYAQEYLYHYERMAV